MLPRTSRQARREADTPPVTMLIPVTLIAANQPEQQASFMKWLIAEARKQRKYREDAAA